jgi:hypothetical protein
VAPPLVGVGVAVVVGVGAVGGLSGEEQPVRAAAQPPTPSSSPRCRRVRRLS